MAKNNIITEINSEKILSVLPVGLLVSDANGVNVRVNDEAMSMTGYSREELLAGVWMIDHEDTEAWRLWQEAKKGAAGTNYEARLVKKDGTSIWVSISWRPIYDDDGVLSGVCTMLLDISEKKNTEEHLNLAGRRLEDLSDRAADLLWEMAPDGKFTYVSNAVRSLGFEPCEWLGHSIIEFLPEAERIELTRLLADESREPGPRHYEMPLIKKDGTSVWLEILSDAIVTDGRLIGYHGVSRDISTRKQAESALRESEERYKSIVENSKDMIMLTTPCGKVTYISPACFAMTGYTAQEIVDQQIWLVHPDDTDRMRNEFLRARAGETETGIEYRYLTRQGETRWQSQSWSPIMDGDKVRLVVSIIRDITDRVRSAAALLESETRYKGIVEHSSDLIMLCRPDGVWTYASPACKAITGYEPDEVVGTMPMILLPEDQEWMMPIFHRAMEGESGSNLQYRLRTKAGRIKWISHAWTPIFEDGRVNLVLNIIRDITDHKQAEEALRKAHKELKRAYKLQQEFVNNITHEVRTPLTAVKGYAEMLLEGLAGPVSEEQSSLLNKVLTSSDHLLQIVNGVLEVARLRSGKTAVNQRISNPRKAVDRAISALMPQASKKNLILEVLPNSTGCPAMYDADKVQMIVTNLISNAVKFTEKGTITVEVECTQDGAEIVVVDTGIGIAARDLTRIYDEFSQLDFPGKHKPSGFGIGLALVATMVEIMGAGLVVSSAKGVGTAFTLKLPTLDTNS